MPVGTPTNEHVGGSSALGAYHDGLDGMRAVSMTAVLLYHAGLGVQGSFLALSQFFTLSGFLVTGMLVRAHDRGGVDLRGFWVRRVRRLVPASSVAIVGVVLFGATVGTLDQVELLPVQVFAALFWFFNWYLIGSGESYVDLFSSPSPLDHFWSLSLEEQFYLGMSFGFVLLVRRSSSSRVLIGTFAAIAAASAAWAVYLYRSGASFDRVYLGTDTRLTEILFGAILAVVVVRHLREPTAGQRRFFAWGGAAAYVVAVICWLTVPLAPGPIWNGGMVLYAGLTVLVILSVLGGEGPLVRFLTAGPLPAYGRLTYGVYLYHWPVFLWLDEGRTGLAPVPLFVLRMVVTMGLAVASNRFLERPIIEQRWHLPRWLRFGWMPLAFTGLVVASLVVSTRDAPDPSATFRVDDDSLAVPIAADDGVLDVLAITDDSGQALVDRLREDGDRTGDASVVSVPFGCAALVAGDSSSDVCEDWVEQWPELVEQHDPDVVLLFVDLWTVRDMARAAGRALDGDEAADVAEHALGAGFDALTSRGAPVVWARGFHSFAEAVVTADLPFLRAMAALSQSRDDLRVLAAGRVPDESAIGREAYLETGAAALFEDLSLYQRIGRDDLDRVMVIGDSMARSLAFGMERWAVETDRALVWNAATPGCGLAPPLPDADDCDDVLDRLDERVAEFDPDTVLVLTSAWDLTPRQVPGSDEEVDLDDERFVAFLASSYREVIERVASNGATVVWLTAPCSVDGSGPELASPELLDRFNEHVVLASVADAAADGVAASSYDLADVLCPGGVPLLEVDGIGDIRSDGVHFSVDGSIWFAETYGPELLAAGGL